MDKETLLKRRLLFVFGCLVVRGLFVVAAKKVNVQLLPYFGAAALLPVIGWMWIYLVKPRETGAEVFGGKIWWNDLRPIHAGLYAAFAVMAFKKSTYAWVPLLLDVLLGGVAFGVHHATMK